MERWREPWIEQDPRTKHWFIRWRERNDDGIHKRSRLCEGYSDAIDQKHKMRNEMLEARTTTKNPKAPIRPLFEKYMREMENVRGLRPGALVAKRQGINHLLEAMELLGDITRDSLRDLRDDMLDSELSPVTVGIRMREVKAFVRWLYFEGYLTENPWVKLELPGYERKPRFLSDEELSTVERVTTGVFKAICRTAYLTGMRQNEILKATWKDVETVKGQVYITILSTTAKNRRTRTIPLRPEVVQLLGRRGKGQVFAGWDKHKVRWAWDCVREKAEFAGRVRFHDLRHTFCRLYLQGGGTLADLMQITGHQSIVMMQVYAHFEVRYKADRMNAIKLPANFEEESTGRSQDGPPNFLVTEGNTQGTGRHRNDEGDDDNAADSRAVI